VKSRGVEASVLIDRRLNLPLQGPVGLLYIPLDTGQYRSTSKAETQGSTTQTTEHHLKVLSINAAPRAIKTVMRSTRILAGSTTYPGPLGIQASPVSGAGSFPCLLVIPTCTFPSVMRHLRVDELTEGVPHDTARAGAGAWEGDGGGGGLVTADPEDSVHDSSSS
jgi:hypothetical protein